MGLDIGSEDGGLFQEQAREAFENANASPEAIADNALRLATTGVGELDVPTMKKYIQYCKAKCSPRLDEETGDILASSYVKIRDDVRRRAMESEGGNDDERDSDQATIPITVRQLEALIRVSESLAKMRLEDDVQGQDIQEALRLFKVSTMAANTVDQTARSISSGEKGNSMSNVLPSRAEMQRSEAFLRSRLAIGAFVNKNRIVDEAASQGYDATVVSRAIAIMAMKGEIIEKNSGRLFKRIK
jgi:DNA replication licensing factor MCM5